MNPTDPALVFILPFIAGRLSTVVDYLPEDAVVAFDEIKIIDEKLKLARNAHSIRVKSFTEAGEATSLHSSAIPDGEQVYRKIKTRTLLSFQQITSYNPVFEPEAVFNIKSLPVAKYNLNYKALVEDARGLLAGGSKIYIYAGGRDAKNALSSYLLENGLASGEGREISVIPERISRGLLYPSKKLALIGTDDVTRRAEVRKKGSARKAILIPMKGDYVVHETHGIGLSEGVVTMETRDGVRDYYVVLYRGGDRLYLPVDRMDSLEKYTGGGTPALHKLGGKEFERVKERVRASIKKLAIDLVGLYERRLNLKGYKYQPDTVWQKELEDSFEFEETDDQLIAVNEIKEDMERGKVMDRLLAGDVGFGKTEVALRAVFKTVMDGKQAAILAPTTILCRQHYNTALQRFKPFGLKIDILSRFVSEDVLKASLKRIASGETNVVVATHRLLGKDVRFKDLGLLVLDEEQRFGVEHKEKIKVLKNNVNVLSLSATPIPRTLHMALSGIRDISTLETPPKNRLPVETYVVEYSDALIVDALTRELARGGQAFILYNRVETIEAYYKRVSELVPEARVLYAHGRMDALALEERIGAFYNGEADVLVSTTIIENGIDLPDANTLIVIDSDRLGLAEMYQLRGRIGRSGSLAYAYFTVKPGKALTETAGKRLDAILNNTELGSGFRIAAEDLEIRGAGNVLGREQHGNMDKVGYDMYVRILSEAVGELKGVLPEARRDVEIVTDGNVSLPKEYILDGERRVKFYKETAAVSAREEEEAMLKGLEDVYGKPPEGVVNLVSVGLVKNLASRIGVKKVTATKEGLQITFYDGELYKREGVFKALGAFKQAAVLVPSEPPSVLFDNKNKDERERLKLLKEFLIAANENH